MHMYSTDTHTRTSTHNMHARLCSRAGIDDSKKWGMMFLSNQLFKIYFKVSHILLHVLMGLNRYVSSGHTGTLVLLFLIL